MPDLPPFLQRQIWPITVRLTALHRAVKLQQFLGHNFVISYGDEFAMRATAINIERSDNVGNPYT